MYLLARYGGHSAQDTLWTYGEDGIIAFHVSSEFELQQMRVFMQKYRDTPMDLADASLVAAAEALNEVRVFTTDSDFYVYQINGNTPFRVVP